MWVLFVTVNLHHPCYQLPGNAWRSSRNFGYALRCEVGDVLLVCGLPSEGNTFLEHVTTRWKRRGWRGRRRYGPLLLGPDVLWSNTAPTRRFLGAVGACPTYPFLQTYDKYCCERFRQRSGDDLDAARKRSRPDIDWSSLWVQLKQHLFCTTRNFHNLRNRKPLKYK